MPEVVFVNTSGGVTGGDRIAWGLEAGPGAALVATSQAAERVYRSAGGAARIETRVVVGAGAAVEWLPQETILFDGGRLERRLEVEMAEDARVLALECVVLGRRRHGRDGAGGALERPLAHPAGRAPGACRGAADRRMLGAEGPAALRGRAGLRDAGRGGAGGRGAARGGAGGAGRRGGRAGGGERKEGVLVVRWLGDDARALRAGLIRFLIALPERAPCPASGAAEDRR